MPAPPPPRPQKSARPRVPRSDRHLSRHDSWPTTTSIRYHSPDSDPPAFRRSDFSAFYVNLSLPSKIRAPVLIHENIPDLDSGPLPPYLVRSLHESGNPPMLSCAASWLSNLDTAPPIIPSPLPRDCCLLRTVLIPIAIIPYEAQDKWGGVSLLLSLRNVYRRANQLACQDRVKACNGHPHGSCLRI